MHALKIAALGAIVTALAAGPSQATITTFATFATQTGAGNDFSFANSGGASGGSSATFDSINSQSAGGATGAPVTFSFVDVNSSLDNSVTNVSALLNFTSSLTSTPATEAGGQYAIQNGLQGGFTITSNQSITVAGRTYAPGTVLLTATFSNASLAGVNNSTTVNFDGNNETSGYTLTYSSPFLTFQSGATLDATLGLTALQPVLGDVTYGTDALNSFNGFATGSFSADPVPRGIGTPEPQSWALMLVGVGAMGSKLRSRRRLVPARV